MSDTNKQVELIRTSFLKNLASAHPLKEHPIDNCEEYVQKLYIDALTVTAQYENKNAEAANKFIQRIMAGAGLKEPFTEHLKNAFEITPERYGEFLKQCAENKLTDIFLIDSMIIACAAGEPNKKQVDFVAETADMLSVRKNRFEWLTGIAKCILMQSSEEYKAVCEKIPHDEKNEILPNIVCYLKEFVSGVLIDTDNLLWIYSDEKRNLVISDEIKDTSILDGSEYIKIQNKKHVIIENSVVDCDIMIYSCNEVTFKNCELIFVYLKSVGKAQYDSCLLSGENEKLTWRTCDYLYRFFYYENCNGINVVINNCTFSNSGYGKGSDNGARKLTAGSCNVHLEVNSSNFINLRSSVNPLLYDSKAGAEFRNCEFVNCGDPNNYWYKTYVTEENNTYIS